MEQLEEAVLVVLGEMSQFMLLKKISFLSLQLMQKHILMFILNILFHQKILLLLKLIEKDVW